MQVDSIFASPDRDVILRQQINAAIGGKTEWPHKRMKAYVYKTIRKEDDCNRWLTDARLYL